MVVYGRLAVACLLVLVTAQPVSSTLMIRRFGDVGTVMTSWGDTTGRRAKWDFNDSGNIGDQSGGSCGSSCNLTDNNTVQFDSTNQVEGAGQADFETDNNEYLSCDSSTTCTALDVGDPTDLSWCAYVTMEAIDSDEQRFIEHMPGSGLSGIRMGKKGTSHAFRGRTNSNNVDGSALAASTLYWLCIVYDDSAGGVYNYKNGTLDACEQTGGGGGCSSSTHKLSAPSDIFSFSESGTRGLDGTMDAAHLITRAWTADEDCTLGACGGIDTTLCACDSTTPANYKTCTTNADCASTAQCDTTAGECRGLYNSLMGGSATCTMTACNYNP